MTSRTLRSLSAAAVAFAALTASGVAPANPATTVAEVRLLDTELWGMGGSGDPIPSLDGPNGLIATIERYVDPPQPVFAGQPTFPIDNINPLFTPEGLYPFTGIKTLELDPSVAQGLQILHSTITGRIADGHHLVVMGISQSSVISSLEMRALLALPADQRPAADQLAFVLLGNESGSSQLRV